MYCRRCGTPLHQGVVICPECGARQRRQASSVRCASCHGRVPMGLTVCPHCGRDVRVAGPRWGLWAAGLVVLALVVLWSLGSLPVEQAGQEVARVRSKLSSLVQVLGPVAQGATRPMQPLETPQAVVLIAQASTPAASDTPAESQPDAQSSEEAAPPVEEVIPEVVDTPEVTPTSVVTSTGAITGTLTPGAQPLPATATAAPTTQPTATPTVTPTPTVAPTPTPLAPTATPTVAKTAPAAGNALTYRVRSGDVLSTIAAQFNVSLDALLAANQLTARSILRIGQELVIPGSNAPIPPTATSRPQSTATPTPLPPTPAPYLAAPVLVNPGDGSSHRESEEINLTWQPVPGLAAGNQYQVTMRWAEQGVPQEYYWFTTATGTRVPPWLWGRADQPARQYTWFVRAVQVTTDGQGGELAIPLSLASPTRTLYWN